MDGMTIAGVRPLVDLVDLYVIYEDGTPAHLQVPDGRQPELARPGAFVSRERYGERLAELHAETAARVARLQQADEERQRADYQALLGSGVPDDTARRMAGYEGPGGER